jgi:uncharacterized membrane protein
MVFMSDAIFATALTLLALEPRLSPANRRRFRLRGMTAPASAPPVRARFART